MATTEPDGRARMPVGLIAIAIVGALAAVFLFARETPQMGTDRETFATVDALFTAVTGKDEQRLGECEQRLKGHREAGKLPPPAAAALDGIIAKARAGSWETATTRLYDFMLAQRREGVIEPKQDKKVGRQGRPGAR